MEKRDTEKKCRKALKPAEEIDATPAVRSWRSTRISAATMTTIWTLNEFENVWLLTRGGPGILQN